MNVLFYFKVNATAATLMENMVQLTSVNSLVQMKILNHVEVIIKIACTLFKKVICLFSLFIKFFKLQLIK